MTDSNQQDEPLAMVQTMTPGKGLEVVFQGKVYAIFHTPEGFFAVDGMCPHAGGPLAQGTLRGKVVTCPWHGWQFDVTTGQHCLNPRIQTTCQRLVERDGSLYFA